MSPPPLPPDLRPATERVFGLDVARGLAILGLIFANMPGFASADQYRDMTTLAPEGNAANRAAEFILEFLIGGKCVALLSFLLGAGLAMQQAKAEAAGRSFTSLAVRRMAGLLLLGAFHILFLWWGDILCAYALLGFGLLLFQKAPAAVVRTVAILGILLPTLFVALLYLVPEGPEDHTFNRWVGGCIKILNEVYQNGSYGQILIARLIEAALVQFFMLFLFPVYFGMLLLGYDAIRRRWFPWPGRSRITPWLASGGVACVVLCAFAAALTVYFPTHPVASAFSVFAGLCGSLGFALLVLIIALRLPKNPASELVAAVGRTALSNYLFQSLCAAVIFQGWGLGLYGRMSYGQTLLVAGGIVVLQLAWPIWWLNRFRYGPMEFVWRLLTYGKATGKMRLA